MTVLFIQQRSFGFQLDDLDALRSKNSSFFKGLFQTTLFPITFTPTTKTTSTTATTRAIPKNYVNATACESSVCKLPFCRCAGSDTPGSLPISNTPQMIVFAMNGGINVNNYQFYKSLDGTKSVNGCPFKMTFFVSGDYVDYTMVQERSKLGHEIADYSVTHQSPNTWWANANRQQLESEILNQRANLNSKSSSPVYGWRSPFLEATELTYQILYENNFLYDSSLVTRLSERWWPYTLDYLPSAPCYLTNCPKKSYPGLWEVPLHVWSDGSTGNTCITFDQCLSSLIEGDENSVYKLLMQNFNMNYLGGKQPFIMFGTSLWLDPKKDYRQKGLIKFINEMIKLPDVYFVTAKDLIDWTKNPVGLDSGAFPCMSSAASIPSNVPTIPTISKDRGVYKPATPCDPSICVLPNCRCTGSDIPGGLLPSNTPQMILFTMDDGVNINNIQTYKDLFDGFKNSNGCPAKGSFFVSGDNTDYAMVKELKDRGHEIGDHSATHKFPISWWSDGPSYEELEFEILTQKSTLETKSNVQINSWRNPFLASTENTFKVLADNKFLYDSSIATAAGVRWWPYTFDYLPTIPCQLKNCPINSYPGLWEMPLNTWSCNDNGAVGAMFDDCSPYLVDQDSESVYKLFMKNFLLHYNDKRTPFSMFAHYFWFTGPTLNYRKQGLIKFMNEVRLRPDVFFVSVKDAVQWTKNPIGLDKKPFSC
ncbi:uncharacterized protein LOC124814910 isoform X2 [Hydra vulgaris]|uniref:uncharacterized protein LOC124814910 isoform X2 n=2 Tax=Hydra vulgaris TaxID=6087 RepID=UPI001F5F2C67|nr:uncharacterized protein LOC124814910 isoform X1 [Hydra vulgaris]